MLSQPSKDQGAASPSRWLPAQPHRPHTTEDEPAELQPAQERLTSSISVTPSAKRQLQSRLRRRFRGYATLQIGNHPDHALKTTSFCRLAIMLLLSSVPDRQRGPAGYGQIRLRVSPSGPGTHNKGRFGILPRSRGTGPVHSFLALLMGVLVGWRSAIFLTRTPARGAASRPRRYRRIVGGNSAAWFTALGPSSSFP